MDKIDHENTNPDECLIDLEVKEKINNSTTLQELSKIHQDHKIQYEHSKHFIDLLSSKRKEIEESIPQKEIIGNVMLNNAIKSIKEGATDKDEFLERYYLDAKQLSHFNKELNNGK